VPDPYVIIEVDWPLDKKGRTAATGKGRPKFSTRGGFVKAYTPAKTREFEDRIKTAAIDAVAARSLKPLAKASVAIDGSKFKAVSSRDNNFTKGKMERSPFGARASGDMTDRRRIDKPIDFAPQFRTP
jgi:hypothetical protein